MRASWALLKAAFSLLQLLAVHLAVAFWAAMYWASAACNSVLATASSKSAKSNLARSISTADNPFVFSIVVVGLVVNFMSTVCVAVDVLIVVKIDFGVDVVAEVEALVVVRGGGRRGAALRLRVPALQDVLAAFAVIAACVGGTGGLGI